MNDRPHALGQIQRWMKAVITHPGGVEAGIRSADARASIDIGPDDVEQVVCPSQALTADKRLAVYATAYYARLLDCLRNEFPVFTSAVGEKVFGGFAVGYLQAYPSRSYTLGRLGANFSRYLGERRPPGEDQQWPDLLIDLAAFEWAVGEVFDGAGTETSARLSPREIEAIPPEKWSHVRLVPAPCLRVMSFRFPVRDFFIALRRNEPTNPPPENPSWVAITRRDYVVRHYDVTRVQFELLRHVISGATVGEAIGHAAEVDDQDLASLASSLEQWFRGWAADGYFSAIEAPG